MQYPKIREIVEEWVRLRPEPPAMLLGEDQTAATSRGTFLGQNTSDPKAVGSEIYSDPTNLPTAIASLLNHSQVRANFHPANTPPEQLAVAFAGYVNEIDSNPFFHLQESSQDKQAFYSSDYNLLIDQVVNLYKGVSAEALDEIKTSITDMAKSVFGQARSEQWKNVFSQSTIDMSNPSNPIFYLYYTSLHMFHEKSGKSEVSEQDYEVRVTSYLILPDLIRAHAGGLASLDKKSVDDWLGGATSPERPEAKLCFRSRPFRA